MAQEVDSESQSRRENDLSNERAINVPNGSPRKRQEQQRKGGGERKGTAKHTRRYGIIDSWGGEKNNTSGMMQVEV